MIALDDAALARICIACGAIPYERRDWLLRFIANTVDPSRQLLNYRDRRKGIVRRTVRAQVDLHLLCDFLRDQGCVIAEWCEDADPQEFARILGTALEQLIERSRYI